MTLNISDVNWTNLTATRTLVSLISSSSRQQQQHNVIHHTLEAVTLSMSKYRRAHCTQQLNDICGCCVWVTGDRAFAAAATIVWNSLPEDVQTSISLQLFRRRLKSEFFRRSLGPRHSTWLSFLCNVTLYFHDFYVTLIEIRLFLLLLLLLGLLGLR